MCLEVVLPQRTFETITGEFVEDLATVRDDLARLSDLAVDMARHQAKMIRAQLQGSAYSQRRAGLKATILRDPLPSLLLALVGGFALGLLKRR